MRSSILGRRLRHRLAAGLRYARLPSWGSEVRTMELLFGTALAVWLLWSTAGGLYLMFEEGEKGIAEDEIELDTES